MFTRPSRIIFHVAQVVFCATLLFPRPVCAQFSQQGSKLVASDLFGAGYQGWSVAISADGNTAIVGAPQTNGLVGAATIWTRDNGVWTQQGPSLRGSGVSSTYSLQGQSVSLSADGNTAAVGGSGETPVVPTGSTGAVWIWTRNAGVWSQQGPKLVGTGAIGPAEQGSSVALSADGNTLIVGGSRDNNDVGATWVWTRSAGVWTQQGDKLVGSGATGASGQGRAVALSADGNTAIVGGPGDDNAGQAAGAAWIWTRSGNTWSQQGAKLTGSDRAGLALQGIAVSLASDGNTAIVGGVWDNLLTGAVWVWTRSAGIWNRQGPKLVGSGAMPSQVGSLYGAGQGTSISLSGDGNTAIVGGNGDDLVRGATWVWTRSSGAWTQQGSKLVGSGAASPAGQGSSVALSTDGKTAIVAGRFDNSDVGAVWIFATPQAPVIATHPASRIVLAGMPVTFTAGVTANPAATVQWQISANGGSVFTDISGATSPSYSFTTSAPSNGNRYRAVFTNSEGSATTNDATLTVVPPTMSLNRASLRFGAVTTGSSYSSSTPPQTVRLSQTGSGTVTWTAVSSVPWLVVSPASGTGPANLTVSTQFVSGLSASQSGHITFTFGGAANAAGSIVVALETTSPSDPASPPFGSFDTPAGDATALSGSVAVTGWALDNIGVQRVELWRDLVTGETTAPFAGGPTDPRNGKVFIANAPLVDGARPDIEALYGSPASNRAGWGYLMLTWGLWNQGSGTYRLSAFAFDQESNVATLGSKTIVVNNNAATKPFGSIDTPAVGGEASGPNFGWALTPKVTPPARCTVQPSGVQVSIDSGPLQPVVFGALRVDIAAAFTGFSNSTASGGYYIFDWSTLASGPHTIGWLVRDDCNRVEGIGSRFFNVSNGTNLVALEPPAGTSAMRAHETESDAAITVARGFGELPVILPPGEAGSRTVEVKQGERIEMRLPHGFVSVSQLAKDGERRALPTGSTWDSASGIFYWQPAPGFLGRYRLVFSNGTERISVRVVVTP